MVVPFDQHPPRDDYPGEFTAQSVGGSIFRGDVTDLNSNYFLHDIHQFEFATTNTSNKLPFEEADPSRLFETPPDLITADGIVTPDLGDINGISGPDAQYQADANASFQLKPGSIHGYKFKDVNGNGVDDNEPRLEGWTFFLDENNNGSLDWTDAGFLNDTWDFGEGERWTTTDAKGEFWFTDLPLKTNGTKIKYYVREVVESGWRRTTTGQNPDFIEIDVNGREHVAFAGQSMIADDMVPRWRPGRLFDRVGVGVRFHDRDADGVDDDGFTGQASGCKRHFRVLLTRLFPGPLIETRGRCGYSSHD